MILLGERRISKTPPVHFPVIQYSLLEGTSCVSENILKFQRSPSVYSCTFEPSQSPVDFEFQISSRQPTTFSPWGWIVCAAPPSWVAFAVAAAATTTTATTANHAVSTFCCRGRGRFTPLQCCSLWWDPSRIGSVVVGLTRPSPISFGWATVLHSPVPIKGGARPFLVPPGVPAVTVPSLSLLRRPSPLPILTTTSSRRMVLKSV